MYLSKLQTESTTNVAGGLMRGDDTDIHGAQTNTGCIAAGNNLFIAAREFINQNHLADFGRDTRDLIS